MVSALPDCLPPDLSNAGGVLRPTPMKVDLHRAHCGIDAAERVVVDHLEAEVHLFRRDRGRARGGELDRRALLLARFDRAARDFPTNAVSVNDKAAAVKIR